MTDIHDTTVTVVEPDAVAGPVVWLTPAEVCERLRVADQTLANWRYKRIGPPYLKVSGERGKPGGSVRYREDQLNEWMAAKVGAP